MNWSEALRRISAGEDTQAVLDDMHARDNAEFVAWLRAEVGDEAADRHMTKIREIETGVYGARGTWAALTSAQRRVLMEARTHGGRLDRCGKEYRHTHPSIPIRVATVRSLCARDLMAWDGGAFDPEAAAVVTERGMFVLKHGADP